MSRPPGRGSCAFLAIVLTIVAAARAADAQTVSFAAADGFRVFADYCPPKPEYGDAPIVILLHMYQHDRKSWEPLIRPLHEAGFAVLAIDMRGHGQSATSETEKRVESRDPQLFKDVYEDVRGAYDWLAQQKGVDRSRFALVGASVGCSIALRYAAQDKSVDAVVCLTPGVNYLGLDSKRDLPRVTGRKILLMATEDERDACDALQPLTDGVQVRIRPGQAHGTRMFGVLPDLEREIVSFLKQAVGQPTKAIVYGSISSNVYHPPESAWIARIKPTNLRYYSSPQEAEARGLRRTKSLRVDDKADAEKKP